jgi:hypothetical protein
MPSKTLEPDDPRAERYEKLRLANRKPGKPLPAKPSADESDTGDTTEELSDGDLG